MTQQTQKHKRRSYQSERLSYLRVRVKDCQGSVRFMMVHLERARFLPPHCREEVEDACSETKVSVRADKRAEYL